MAESMQGLKRSHRCGELSAANVQETVTIMGWVQKNRNKGGLVFVDVRDCSGIIQVVFEEGRTDKALLEKAASLKAEYVVAVVGTVERRSGAVNENLSTGEIEVVPSQLRILVRIGDAAVSDRRECKDERRGTLKIQVSGFKKTGFAEKPDAEEQGGDPGAPVPCGRGIFGD